METALAQPPRRWYRDRACLKFIAFRYVPLLGVLNLFWEIVQLPLYTVWAEGSLPYLAYVVVHCTLGDLVIGASALVSALVATRAGTIDEWKLRKVGLVAVVAGVGYTVLSEWMNTIARPNWEYSALMPVVHLAGLRIGLSPLAQWLIVPPMALWLAWLRSVKKAKEDGR
jgi:hypothetical protein